MSTQLAAVLRALALIAAVLAGPTLVHEGHNHGAVPPPVFKTVAALSALSLALVFVILYSRYRSAALALIIIGNVPLVICPQ